MKSLKALLFFILVALLVWPVSTPIHAAGAVHVEARYEQANNQQAMLRMVLVNDDTQALTNLSFRYFMDLTEVIKAGYSSNNVKLDIYYSSATATVSPIKVFDAAKNIYYYEVSFGTYSLAKSSRIEANFSIHLNGWQQVWNSANDHSFTGLTNSTATTQYIPVYQSGTIIYGKEPSGYDTTPPATPTGLTATAISTSQINLDWADNTETDLAKYRIYAGTSSGSLSLVGETTTSAYNHTGLASNTTYYYQVTAVDVSGNESTKTTISSAKTLGNDTTPPAVPTGLKATAVSTSQINLDWADNTESDLAKYKVYAGTASGSLNFVAETTTSSYNHMALIANTTYYYQITAVDTSGNESTRTTVTSATTLKETAFTVSIGDNNGLPGQTLMVPVKFSSIPASGVSSCRFAIQYDSAVLEANRVSPGTIVIDSSEFSYNCKNDTSPGEAIILFIDPTLQDYPVKTDGIFALVEFTIKAGAPAGNYRLSIEPTGASFASIVGGNVIGITNVSYSDGMIKVNGDTTPPATPTGLTATAISASQINLDWADNTETDLAKYRIYAGTSSGSLSLVGETTTSAYNHTGLAPNTTYYYQITAVDASGNESAKTTIASAKTLENDITPPAAPTGLTAAAVSASQINLDWADNTETDLAKYRIYAGTSSGSLSLVAETTASNYNHTGLMADTLYYYQVTAVDTDGNESMASQQVSARTQSSVTGKIHVEARYDQGGSQSSQIRMNVINDDTKSFTNLSARYFLDLSEVVAAGYSPSNVTLDMYYSSAPATVSSIKAFNAAKNIYYIEISWGTYSLSAGRRIEANFSIHLNGWQSAWNAGNDWSFTGLTTSNATTVYIPVYQSGTLIYGREPNNSPTISITNPTGGTEYSAPAVITIRANAADTDGTIAKVEFYAGTLKLGEDTASPYEYAWSGMDPGSYSLTAKATDDGGAETTSTAVGIVINPPDTDPPTVSITSPLDGATLEAPADIIIRATATDSDGTVTKVEFYNGTTKIGEATTAPYTFTWTNVPMGTYYLIATAIDNLGAKGTSAQVKVVVSSDNAYLDHFLELYQDLHTKGYLSQEGVPYHCIETMIIEGPDYGHLTTSEAFSFYIWLEAMYGRITQDWTKLQTAWEIMEKYIIPSHQDQPTNDFQKVNSPSTYAPEYLLPDYYPTTMDSSAPVGPDPLFTELKTTYGTSDIYGMHWLLDVDNWYGYGNRGDGTSRCSYINNYQRGPQESTWETVPHPSWEAFKWGGPNGFLDLFLKGGTYAPQWRYTNAPDADARAIQALYWAKMWSDEQGGSAIVDALVPKAAKMGDFLRYSFFDKHFKPIGCTDPKASVGTNPYDSCHYLMSWYYSWGGATDATAGWAFRIGCSYSHFGYQNPLAAYVLGNLNDFAPLSPNAVRDWKASLQRQVEFYRWLQTADGAIAGGCTNSWEGAYKVPPAGTTTFYKMAYDVSPSYLDPPSNRWFGMQAWSMERMAEYLYVSKDTKAKVILDKWVKWVKASVKLYADGNYEIPCDLTWSGQPGTNWDATHQNWDPADTAFNSNLRVSITNYTQDTGVTAALAKALIYYAKATGDDEARVLAKELLDRMWALFRDDKGVSCPEPRSDYNRIFDQTVYIPSGWSGKMANGDPIKPGIKFIDIRSKYREDPDWHIVEEAYNNKSAPVFHYHRFWGNADIALAYATYGLMFP